MKKHERLVSVNQALLRASAGLASASTLAGEIEAGVTGTISPDEAQKLVEKQKWTPEVVQTAINLGLIKEQARKTRAIAGGVHIGNIQAQFAEKHAELFNGRSKMDESATQMLKDWIEEYGVRNAFRTVRNIVKATDVDFSVGIYFILAKKEEAPAV